MKEELLHVGGSEEAGAEVPVESVSEVEEEIESVVSVGVSAMQRMEVMEVRVGGPRVIRNQGQGKSIVLLGSLASFKQLEPMEESVVEEESVEEESQVSVGVSAMQRMEVMEVRVGGPRLIRSQGPGKSSCKSVVLGSLASFKRRDGANDRETSSATIPTVMQLNYNNTLIGFLRLGWFASLQFPTNSWSSTIYFVGRGLCMQACKIFVLARRKKPPDRRQATTLDEGTTGKYESNRRVKLCLVTSPRCPLFSLSLFIAGFGRIGTETRNYEPFACECFA
jgi:hypothetical protein